MFVYIKTSKIVLNPNICCFTFSNLKTCGILISKLVFQVIYVPGDPPNMRVCLRVRLGLQLVMVAADGSYVHDHLLLRVCVCGGD